MALAAVLAFTSVGVTACASTGSEGAASSSGSDVSRCRASIEPWVAYTAQQVNDSLRVQGNMDAIANDVKGNNPNFMTAMLFSGMFADAADNLRGWVATYPTCVGAPQALALSTQLTRVSNLEFEDRAAVAALPRLGESLRTALGIDESAMFFPDGGPKASRAAPRPADITSSDTTTLDSQAVSALSQRDYLAWMHSNGGKGVKDAAHTTIVETAATVCQALTGGIAVDQIVAPAVAKGMSEPDIEAMLGGAVKFYCPKFEPMITELTSMAPSPSASTTATSGSRMTPLTDPAVITAIAAEFGGRSVPTKCYTVSLTRSDPNWARLMFSPYAQDNGAKCHATEMVGALLLKTTQGWEFVTMYGTILVPEDCKVMFEGQPGSTAPASVRRDIWADIPGCAGLAP